MLGLRMDVRLLCYETLKTRQVQGTKRKCTDCLFLLLLLASWFAMTFLGLIVTGVISSGSLEPGDPRRLINGIDYDGRICGVDTGVKVCPRDYHKLRSADPSASTRNRAPQSSYYFRNSMCRECGVTSMTYN